MKKTLMSVVMASVLVSGSAFADGAKKENSRAIINFDGTVTSSLCQVDQNSLEQTVRLGDATIAQVKDDTAGRTSFSIQLVNCDTTVNDITYTIKDQYGSGQESYLTNSYKGGYAAENVAVYLEDDKGTPLDTDVPHELKVNAGQEEYTIGLKAYMGPTMTHPTTGTPTAMAVGAGIVNAKAVMLIKAAVNGAVGP